MRIYQIIYTLALAVSFMFFVLYPPWISSFLFVLILILAPIDLIASLPGMLTKGMLLSVPPVLNKDEYAVLTLTTTHKKSYPVKCIVAKMHVNGDDFSVKYKLRCLPENNERREVAIDTSHSGVITFSLKRIWSVSLLGLFALPTSINIKQSVLVLPLPIKPVNPIVLQHGTHLRPKPGGGFSEEHDVRKYRRGDPVRSIHWKVSAKYDSLFIREPLIPQPHSRLVHVMAWKNIAERDLILGRLRWVSGYLLKRKMPFYIRICENSEVVEVTHENELIDFLRFTLGDNVKGINKLSRLPVRFSWVFRIDTSGASGRRT